MANLRRNGSKSDLEVKKSGAPYLENVVSKIEERRDNLANRQYHLKEKITAMERSIPALMAFNMWTSGRKCDDAPLCKIRQIMKRVTSRPDPTEILMDNLTKTVKSLNTETAELHDKIIAAGIKLEESDMELESLELANREFEDRLKSLEKELSKKKTLSLHSIHSEDLFCLTRIRQLGEEEVNLKHSIRELEDRQTLFQEQMDRILNSREFQKSMRKNQSNVRNIHPCPLNTQTNNAEQTKKKLMGKGEVATISKEKSLMGNSSIEVDPLSADSSNSKNMDHGKLECATKASRLSTCRYNGGAEEPSNSCPCPTPALLACYDKSSCPAASRTSTSGNFQSSRNFPRLHNVRVNKCSKHQQPLPISCSPKTCCCAMNAKSNPSRGEGCATCCKKSPNLFESSGKLTNRSITIESKCCKTKLSRRIPAIPKCPVSTMCKKCHGLIFCRERPEAREPSRCRCSCKGKCAKGESDVPCNCAEYLESNDEGYQPRGDSTRNDESSADEEYSECCDCGCDDSDLSDSCQC